MQTLRIKKKVKLIRFEAKLVKSKIEIDWKKRGDDLTLGSNEMFLKTRYFGHSITMHNQKPAHASLHADHTPRQAVQNALHLYALLTPSSPEYSVLFFCFGAVLLWTAAIFFLSAVVSRL